MYTWMKVTLVSLLFVVLANFVTAQEVTAAPEGAPVTDLWQFTFTGTGDSGSASSRTFNVQLTQLGTLVFGSVVLERWVGENKNGTLSIRTLSQPAKGKQAQQGGLVLQFLDEAVGLTQQVLADDFDVDHAMSQNPVSPRPERQPSARWSEREAQASAAARV